MCGGEQASSPADQVRWDRRRRGSLGPLSITSCAGVLLGGDSVSSQQELLDRLIAGRPPKLCWHPRSGGCCGARSWSGDATVQTGRLGGAKGLGPKRRGEDGNQDRPQAQFCPFWNLESQMPQVMQLIWKTWRHGSPHTPHCSVTWKECPFGEAVSHLGTLLLSSESVWPCLSDNKIHNLPVWLIASKKRAQQTQAYKQVSDWLWLSWETFHLGIQELVRVQRFLRPSLPGPRGIAFRCGNESCKCR